MINSSPEPRSLAAEKVEPFIGTTAALIGMAIAGAASKTASAVIQGKAASKATQTQVDATKAVQAKQDQLFSDYQSQMAPYLNAGKQSTALLGSLMLPPGAPGGYQPPQPPPPPRPTSPQMRQPMGPMGPMGGAPGGMIRLGPGPAGQGINPWGAPAPMPPGIPPSAQPQPYASPWGQTFAPSRMVS